MDALADLESNSIDSVVTDPPYELGFMSKKWDGTGIAYAVPLWMSILRALKPGGHLLAFGGTRTYHRMACAIEDAGFEIRDSLHWIYGTGFPKSLTSNTGMPEGQGTALKPGHEPIILARKPLIGTVAENVAQFGTGSLNIDACRIGEGTGKPKPEYVANFKNDVFGKGMGGGAWENTNGRWPANVIFDEEAAGGLGDPARYFYVAKASRKERDLGCEHLPPKTGGEATDRVDGSKGTENPRAGAGRTGGARNYHPTVKPVELMRYLVRLVTPAGGLVLDPFAGSGTTGMAARLEGLKFVGIEREPEYFTIAKARIGAAL